MPNEPARARHSAGKGTITHKLAAYLRGRIKRASVKPGDKIPSRSALARHFHVSLPTVTAAISMLSKQGLVEFVPGKGFFVPVKGARQPRPLTIGLIGWYASRQAGSLPEFDHYWKAIYWSLVAEAATRGFGLSLIPGTDHEPLDIEKILSHRPDALISHGICLRWETVHELRRRGVPLVLGNRHLVEYGVSYVDDNAAKGFHDAVRIFSEHGHRRIACILVRPFIRAEEERWRQAFEMELVRQGCFHGSGRYWRVLTANPESDLAGALEKFGESALGELLDSSTPITAVYCLGSAIAAGAVKAAAERGLKVGEGISIIDDATSEDETSLSTFLSPCEELGVTLIETVTKLLKDPLGVYQLDVAKRFLDRVSIARVKPDA